MHVVSGSASAIATDQSCVLAIGNFDGLHLGHQVLLRKAKDLAKKLGVPCGALTFAPHPVRHFHPESAPFEMFSSAQKTRALMEFGFDTHIVLEFDQVLQ
mgnify:CR=1 FL=1